MDEDQEPSVYEYIVYLSIGRYLVIPVWKLNKRDQQQSTMTRD